MTLLSKPARRSEKKNVDTNVSVDWRSTENFMALYNNYIGRFLQYVSIAMANGPLAYESTPELQSTGNGTETNSSHFRRRLDNVFASCSSYTTNEAPTKLYQHISANFRRGCCAVLFPLFTRRAIRRAREGKMDWEKTDERPKCV